MGKRNNGLGKLIAFTTAAAAIGGICYIFRDKIKESSIYKTASDKAEDIYGSVKEKINKDEDFFFDDWDDDFEEFEDTASNDDNNRGTNNREYTSISSVNNDIFAHTASFNESASVPAEDIEAKASAGDSAIDSTKAPAQDSAIDSAKAPAQDSAIDSTKAPAEDSAIDSVKASAQDSAIDLTQASTEASDVNTDSNLTEEIPTIEFNTSSYSLESIPEAYENEGLSDTSEDPDVLEDQDKLDF